MKNANLLDEKKAPTAVGSGALLGIVNALFGAKCKNLDSVDVSSLWTEMAKVIKPRLMNVMYLRYEKQMSDTAIAKKVGLSKCRINQMRHKALRITRWRCRNEIIGWWNLTRDA
jgi:hypothetical protein